MTPQDIDNAANILRAIRNWLSKSENHCISISHSQLNTRVNLNTYNGRELLISKGESLTECLEKAGIKVEQG